MADTIFDTRANPDVTQTKTTTQQAPSYYTNYLSGLSQAGQTALAAPNKVAPLTEMQQQGFAATPGAATAYRPGLTAAEATAGTAAAGAVPQIQDFMSPYTTNVVDEMERLQQRNIQRNLMPQLKAGFVSTGGLGSQRYANAMGQTMSDLQSDLTGRQYGALDKGYSDAVTAALNNIQTQNQAARTQGDLATSEQALGLTGAGALTKAGTEQQTYNQSLIDAPMKTAMNASTLMRGYTVPGTTVTEDKGPLSKEYYAGSPLAQTLGVGASLASMFGDSPALDAAGKYQYDPSGKLITKPNSLQKLLDSSGIGGLASAGGSSISNFFKGFGGSSSGGGSSGGVKPGEGYTPGSGGGVSAPSMNTSGGVKYNGDGTITDSAGNVFDSNGDYLGPAPNDAGANDSAGPNADFDDYTPYSQASPTYTGPLSPDYDYASNDTGIDPYLAQEAALNDGMGYADVYQGLYPEDYYG
jgi:hypothetical protein